MARFENELSDLPEGARLVEDTTIGKLVTELCYDVKTAAGAVAQRLGQLVDKAIVYGADGPPIDHVLKEPPAEQ